MGDERAAILAEVRALGEREARRMARQLAAVMGGQVRRTAWELGRALDGQPPIDVAALRARLLREEMKER